MILFRNKKKPSDCKQIFVSSVIKAKSIWLKRTVKVHRRQWGFCLLFSKLHVILFGAPSPSHTHPTQVQRRGWLTGFWLKPASLHFPCHLMSCGSLSQTQKPLSTPTGVFGFDFVFHPGAFGEEQQSSAKAIQNPYAPRAAALRGRAEEQKQFRGRVPCPRGTER